MKLLLETNVLPWRLIEPAILKGDVLAVLEDPEHNVLFSAVSVWETAITAAFGRADFQVSPEAIVTAAKNSGLLELPVRAIAASKFAMLPHHHRDPFDRLLVAQAMGEPAMLYTADTGLAVYSELEVWVQES